MDGGEQLLGVEVPDHHQRALGRGAVPGFDDPAVTAPVELPGDVLGCAGCAGVAPLVLAVGVGGDDGHVGDVAGAPAQHLGAGIVLRGARHPGGGVAQERVLVGAGQRDCDQQGGGDQPHPAARADPGRARHPVSSSAVARVRATEAARVPSPTGTGTSSRAVSSRWVISSGQCHRWMP